MGEAVGKAVVLFARSCIDIFLAHISFNLLGCLLGRTSIVQKCGGGVGNSRQDNSFVAQAM